MEYIKLILTGFGILAVIFFLVFFIGAAKLAGRSDESHQNRVAKREDVKDDMPV